MSEGGDPWVEVGRDRTQPSMGATAPEDLEGEAGGWTGPEQRPRVSPAWWQAESLLSGWGWQSASTQVTCQLPFAVGRVLLFTI